MKKIELPLSGENRYVGFHMPRELYDFVRQKAETDVTTTAATIRGILVDHLRQVGMIAAPDKGINK